jgi:hypothetical protein
VTEHELTRLERAASERLGPGTKLGDVGALGDIIFAPVSLFDSVGILLDRRGGEVEILRSALSLDLYVWAKQRGFRLHAPNQLVITRVAELEAAVALLRCAFDARYIRAALLDMGKTPLSLSLDWPQSALLIEQLRTTDAIDYEVNPP